jgi:hypothetical protein
MERSAERFSQNSFKKPQPKKYGVETKAESKQRSRDRRRAHIDKEERIYG